jgi:hypothetical protein
MNISIRLTKVEYETLKDFRSRTIGVVKGWRRRLGMTLLLTTKKVVVK